LAAALCQAARLLGLKGLEALEELDGVADEDEAGVLLSELMTQSVS
jgi:hypothetical protein